MDENINIFVIILLPVNVCPSLIVCVTCNPSVLSVALSLEQGVLSNSNLPTYVLPPQHNGKRLDSCPLMIKTMKRSEHTPSFALDLGAHSIYKNNNVIIEKIEKIKKSL